MLISIKKRDGDACAKLSLIFIRMMNATNIMAVKPAEAKNPRIG